MGSLADLEAQNLRTLDYDNIEFYSQGVKILVKRSKTDQSGVQLKLSPTLIMKNFALLLVLLLVLIKKFLLPAGKVFGISDKSVALIIKKYAKKAFHSKYAGHSFRSFLIRIIGQFGAEEKEI